MEIERFDNGFEYKVTVIIPVYNVEQYLEECLDSLLAQTIPQEEMEVLMINDGSPDGSLAICERYAAQYGNFKVLSQENQGVSTARNNGIRNAKGKYLMYLDSDDTLSPGTVKNVTDFFDKHYDEVDVVAFPIVFCYENGTKGRHNRDKFLRRTNVYNVEENQYVNLTTINAVVKNKWESNILFDEKMRFHEDEAYFTAIVMGNGKYGYVCEANYYYKKHANGITNQLLNPYYIFESTINFYKELFEKYSTGGRVNLYVQALVLNDFGWKIPQDAIYPYHYSENDFSRAIEQIKGLLCCIDDDLIINHPNMDIYHRFYLLSLKRNGIEFYSGQYVMALCREKHIIGIEKTITVVFTKIKITNQYVEWHGFLKSPFFIFSSVPELYVDIKTDEESYSESLTLLDSAHGYYKSKIKTNQFWRFQFQVPSNLNGHINLRIIIDGNNINYNYYFMPDLSFKTGAKYASFYCQGTECTRKNLAFFVARASEENQKRVKAAREKWYWKHNKKFWLVRKLATLNNTKRKRVWLYYDSTGVGKDNGYYQFIHDIKQDDGIIRYYVTHDIEFAQSADFEGIPQGQVIIFGTKKHRFLYLQCEKVITAYIERYNYIPFDPQTYGHYRDINEPEIIYLQHGVLHAHLPHKYSFDRLNIDREVVSTHFEVKNLIESYHFRKDNLILSGMPRYDFIDTKAATNNTKKILFAPSWRQYLISMSGGVWKPEYKRFEASKFYKTIKEFLESADLAQLLEKYDYTLDFKLHPIFMCYKDLFTFSNTRIRLAEANVPSEEYSVFISDFSSFTFDFVYLKRAILYFFPDYDMFKAGLMSYRELDIPLEEGFGPLVHTADDTLRELELIVQNQGCASEIYQQRMKNFFLHYDNGQRERIYYALMKNDLPQEDDQKFKDMLMDDSSINRL